MSQVLLSASKIREMSPMLQSIVNEKKRVVNDIFKLIKENNSVGNIQMEYTLATYYVKNKTNNEIYIRKIYSHVIQTLKGLDYDVKLYDGNKLLISWGYKETEDEIKQELELISSARK